MTKFNMSITTELELHIQEAIKQGCVSVVEIQDYIENVTGRRYSYGRVLRGLYE